MYTFIHNYSHYILYNIHPSRMPNTQNPALNTQLFASTIDMTKKHKSSLVPQRFDAHCLTNMCGFVDCRDPPAIFFIGYLHLI